MGFNINMPTAGLHAPNATIIKLPLINETPSAF
jgi:hypothetical protein